MTPCHDDGLGDDLELSKVPGRRPLATRREVTYVTSLVSRHELRDRAQKCKAFRVHPLGEPLPQSIRVVENDRAGSRMLRVNLVLSIAGRLAGRFRDDPGIQMATRSTVHQTSRLRADQRRHGGIGSPLLMGGEAGQEDVENIGVVAPRFPFGVCSAPQTGLQQTRWATVRRSAEGFPLGNGTGSSIRSGCRFSFPMQGIVAGGWEGLAGHELSIFLDQVIEVSAAPSN